MKVWSLILLILLTATQSTAQSKLKHSRHSYLVRLYLTDGSQHSGIWMDCNDSSISVSDLHNTALVTAFSPEQIYKLEIGKLNSIKRNALIGAGVGFIVGFAIGWDEFQSDFSPTKSQREHALGAGLLGGFVGGFVGFLSGMIGKTYILFGNPDRYREVLPDLSKYKYTVNKP